MNSVRRFWMKKLGQPDGKKESRIYSDLTVQILSKTKSKWKFFWIFSTDQEMNCESAILILLQSYTFTRISLFLNSLLFCRWFFFGVMAICVMKHFYRYSKISLLKSFKKTKIMWRKKCCVLMMSFHEAKSLNRVAWMIIATLMIVLQVLEFLE